MQLLRSVEQSKREQPDFRALFQAAPGLCLVVLPDAPDYTIVATSDAYNRATMTDREEIVGRGIFEVFPDNPDDPHASGVRNLRGSFQRVVSARVADEMPVQKYDIRQPREQDCKFEERWWSIVNLPVLGEDGEVVYVINRIEDITQLVTLQAAETAQRRRSEELDALVRARTGDLEEANRRLNNANEQMAEMLSMISHDLRNPLGTILLTAELVRRPATDPARPTRDPGDVIARAAKRMERLIQELLDVSRIEANAFAIEPVRINVDDLLTEVVEAQRGRAAEASVQLRLEIAEGAREVWADRHRLLQVLENLIGNALKFTGAGGRDHRRREAQGR